MGNYGEYLKENRLARGLTLKDVEKATGINNGNLSRWERGEVIPSIDFCVRLANFYELSVNELLGLEDNFGDKAAKKMLPGLNAEEQKIIEDYRALPAPGKQLVKTTIKTFMETYESERRRTKYSPRT